VFLTGWLTLSRVLNNGHVDPFAGGSANQGQSCPRFAVAVCLQVSVESPEVLVPLLSGITNAWIWTIDRRLGLFSGATVLAAVTAAAPPASTAHAEGRGDVVDMLAEDHGAEDDPIHEQSMLQVCPCSWSVCAA
jgi:hypothetical protein